MNMEKEVLILKIEDILPNRFQPRIKFKEENINELAESIKEHGVIQPIVVRKISDKYEIIAGERRYKASILAGKTTIPAIVTDLDDKNSAEVALIENVQRQNLTPIEEAISYKKILDMGYINQNDLAEKLGKTQSTIANKLRLLNLDEEVQEALLNERISERHARSLLKLDKTQQVEMLNRIINERMTVRKTDEEIKKVLNPNLETNQDLEQPSMTNMQQVDSHFEGDNSNSEIEVLDFNLDEKPQMSQNLEKTEEIPNITIEKEINNMNNNELNIPSEPIIDNLNNEMSNNQNVNLNIDPSSNMNQTMEVPINNMNSAVNMNSIEFNSNINQMPNVNETPTPSQTINPFQTNPTMDINNQQNQPINSIESQNNLETPNSTGGKFFNMFDINQGAPQDLESQQANMNFEENNQNQSNPFNFDSIQNQSVSPAQTNNNQVSMQPMNEDPFENKLNPYSLNDDQQFTNVNEMNQVQSMPTIENTILNSNNSVNNTINQMPTQQFSQPQEKFVSGNLRMVINTIRDCAATIEKYGYHIETEELDFENLYQVIFKINKNN